MRGWLFIKSITPDILPISIDRGFSSFSLCIFFLLFFFFLPSFSFLGIAVSSLFISRDLVLWMMCVILEFGRCYHEFEIISFELRCLRVSVSGNLIPIKSISNRVATRTDSKEMEGLVETGCCSRRMARFFFFFFFFCIEPASENGSRNAASTPLRRALIN